MEVGKKTISLIISTLWLLFSLGCIQKKVSSLPNLQASVLIDPNFTSQSLNEGVLVNAKFSEKDLSRKDIKKWFLESTEKVSQTEKAILLGSFCKYPQAWFYTQIINTDNKSHQLVVDEYNRIRCDKFEVFTLEYQ